MITAALMITVTIINCGRCGEIDAHRATDRLGMSGASPPPKPPLRAKRNPATSDRGAGFLFALRGEIGWDIIYRLWDSGRAKG